MRLGDGGHGLPLDGLQVRHDHTLWPSGIRHSGAGGNIIALYQEPASTKPGAD
jgi:hypothetical protein